MSEALTPDLRDEKHISLNDARRLPWLSKEYTFQTLLSWATVGRRSKGGALVLLETAREGRRIVTSEQAMHRFFEKLTAVAPSPRTPNEARRAHDRANATLKALGF